jgi:hypothetical protein
MSIVQEGNGFPVLCPAVYQYIVSGNITDVNIPDDKIPDLAVRDLVSKVYVYLSVQSFTINVLLFLSDAVS